MSNLSHRNSSARVILIHGNGGGTGSDHWFPAVQRDLEEAGIECLSPDFPDPVLARASYWLPFLQDQLKANEHTVLVGHSSGAIAAMRYAEQRHILGSVLVGTYFTDLGEEDEKLSGYFDQLWGWPSIRDHQQWSAIFASVDDPFIPIAEPRFVGDQLGSEYFEYPDRGHFCGENDSDFPELTQFLRQKLT